MTTVLDVIVACIACFAIYVIVAYFTTGPKLICDGEPIGGYTVVGEFAIADSDGRAYLIENCIEAEELKK